MNLIWPIFYLLATVFVTAVPMVASPVETGFGLLMILSSVPVYYVFILWKNKPMWFIKGTYNVTIFLQRLLIVVGKSKTAQL